MSEKEKNNRRGHDEPLHDEGDNAYRAEQDTASVGIVAEKAVTAAIRTGLTIGETKEKLVIAKEGTKLQTDKKSVNFHSEKRNERFQVDRLTPLDDNGMDDENTDNDDNNDGKNAESAATDGDNGKSKPKEPAEPEVETEAHAKHKKAVQRKMRERMREQRQRASLDERHNPVATANNPFYDDDLSDFEGFEDYNDYNGNENHTDMQPSEPSTDNDNIALDRDKNIDTSNETGNRKVNRTHNGYTREDERTKPFIADNTDKPGKLKINKKTQSLKQEKNDIKLKTDKKDSVDFTLNNHEDKLDRKKRKLRKRQRTSLTTQKYNLKAARLAHASAAGKLIINSADGKTNTGQGQDYAEQEQDNLNRNVVNTASTGLKSVRADFKTFEAALFPNDNEKALQKKFNRKKQYKAQYAKNKAEKAKELGRQAEIKNNVKQNNRNVNGVENIHTGKNTKIGNDSDYSLNSSEDTNALNQRNSDNALNKRNTAKSENTPRKRKSGKSVVNNENDTNINSFNLKQKKATPTDNGIENNNGKNTSKVDKPPTADTKESRLKHDKVPHSRKNDTTTANSTKLKFNKENPSYHEGKNDKLRIKKDKGNSRGNANAPSASPKDKNSQKAMQKKHNKKKIQKTAQKNQKKLSEKSTEFGKKAGKAAAQKTVEAVKRLALLVLQKIIALILFLISQIAAIGALILIPVIIIAIIGVIFLGTTGTMLLSSYLADDVTLTEVSVYYSEKENDLVNSLTESTIKTTYSVDEVNYVFVDNIGHNPHILLSYLTAKYQNFTFDQVKGELDTIFNLQYTKTITVRTENIPILDENGVPTGDYDTRLIADVTLINNGFYDILYERLTADQREHFLLLLETTGNRQYGGFPMNWDWLINITEDFNNLNNGVEAEVPINTPVYGTINGEVVNTAADSVSIQGMTGEDTIIITFSRLNSVTVSTGDTVSMTTVVGYTSDRIFIQIQRNGAYVNPVLFLGSQRQDLVYGTTIPPLTQSEFNALSDYASTALGTPYVFGTAAPPRRTDCSGFVWWAINGSGTKSWSRTTAQGQFNQCDPITLADARPGDLIFFQGTYDTKDSRIVTHVGIYLGNGQMQHSGTPNQITSINTAYWQNHFYSFGRLRRCN